MKRDLTETEKKMCEKGITRRQKNLSATEENLAYNKSLLEKQKYLRKFDDEWRPYIRKQKDTSDLDVIKLIENEIKSEKTALDQEKDQLKNGVTVKQAPGIN